MHYATNHDIVTIDDLDFAVYITREQLQQCVSDIAKKISVDFKDRSPLLLVVLNGAFIFAADLVRYLEIDAEVQFIRLKSYDKMTSTEELQIIGLDLVDVSGRNIVIIEDIVDSGYSMHQLMPMLTQMGASSVTLASLLVKPTSRKYDVDVTYEGFTIPPQFVVGYGLDYNEKGRMLPQIYQLIDIIS